MTTKSGLKYAVDLTFGSQNKAAFQIGCTYTDENNATIGVYGNTKLRNLGVFMWVTSPFREVRDFMTKAQVFCCMNILEAKLETIAGVNY